MVRRSLRGRSLWSVRRQAVACVAGAVAEVLEGRHLLSTVLFEGFEGNFPGDNGWSVGDSNTVGIAYWGGVDSAFGGEAPYAGTRKGYCAAVGNTGTTSAPTYQNSMTAYMSRSINLAGLTTATLSFWYKVPSIENGNYDHLRAYVDSTKLFDVSTPVTSWTQATYSLNAYVGSSHTLKFEFYSDSSGTAEGAYLDDIAVTGTAALTPTSVFASDGSYSDRVQISWSAVAGATGYEVWRSTTNDSSTATRLTAPDVTSTAYDDFSATAGTTYYYWVKGTNGAETGGFSTSDAGYRLGIPTAPTGITASDGTYVDKVRVSWNAAAMATAYEVWRSTSNDSSTAVKITDSDVPGTTYDDATAAIDVTYYYWVKAKNGVGTSGFSSSNSGYLMTIPPAPTGVSASDGVYNWVIVTWSGSNMAVGYEIWRSTTDDSATAMKITSNLVAGYSYYDTTAGLGPTYYYWVKAVNAIGTSGFSASGSGYRMKMPLNPTGLVASDGTYTDKVSISWTPYDPQATYLIYRNTTDDTNGATIIEWSSAPGTSYDDTTAVPWTTYWYWVKLSNAVGTSDFSNSDTGYRVAVPPAPTGVTASDYTYGNGVRISWNASAGATGYEVWRSTSNSSSSATRIASDISSTSYDDVSMSPGVGYWYWVKAVSAVGASAFSSSDFGSRMSIPPAPTGVTASDGTYADRVRVSWAVSNNTTGYEVWRNTSNSSSTATKLNSTDITALTYDDTSAVAGMTYFYWVKAKNDAGASGFSTSNAGYLMQAPSAPTGVTASDGTYAGKVRVSWSAAATAAGYEVWRSTSSDNGTATQIGDVTGTSCDDLSAVVGTTYYYWVKARNAAGVSNFSAGDAGYWLLSAPTTVSASDGAYADQVRVTWTASTGATGYEVWRNTINSNSTAVKITADDVVDTAYDDATAVAGTTYYYWVKAKSETSTSGFSAGDSGYRLGIPAAPTGVTATDGKYRDRVRVSWTAAAMASSYQVWRSTSNDPVTAVQINGSAITGTVFDDTAVTWGTRYFYWIKAANSVGVSDFSAVGWGSSRDILYVDDSAVGAGTGLSWGDAFTSLQAALAQAAAGGEIRVAAGTYKPTTTSDRTISFALKNGVRIAGGYAGYGAADPDLRDLQVYFSVLSGDIGVPGYSFDNSYHVLTGTNVDSTAVLDGFTITAGRTDTLWQNGRGGGLFLQSASPNVLNSRFIANSAQQGGAIYGDESSAPTVVNTLFVGNSASGTGGVLYNFSGRAVLANCTMVGNTTTIYGDAALTNSIVWASTGPAGSWLVTSGPVTYSDIQQSDGVYSGTGNRNLNPQFVRLPSPGADGTWGSSDDDYGDLRLRPLSPLVDAGNGAALVGISTDLAGKPRFADMPTTPDTGADPAVDIGAYEAVPALDVLIAGPYRFAQSPAVTLSGLGSSSAAGALSFAWDLDNDGQYDDAAGANPVVSFTGYTGPVTLTIRLRVTDAAGQNATASSSVTVVPAVLYVDDSAVGAGTGLSWANAFTSLRSALALAAPGTEIRVAGGTYRPTTTTDRSLSFDLQNGVRVLGGYAGYGAADPNARNMAQYASVLSGDIGAANDRSDNSYHVVKGVDLDATAVLDGFTITAGNAKGTGDSNYSGGGLYLSAASPTIANTRFVANSATYGGGAYVEASLSPKMVNCVFVGNTATYRGGAIEVSGSTLTVTNSSIVGNSAGSDSGGLIAYGSNTAILENSIVWFNTAPRYSQFAPNSAGIRATYSAVPGGATGTGNTGADPQFVRNPSPGADGVWGTSDDDYGDLRLRALSPLADMGNNAAAGLVGVTTDIAGNPRFVDIPTGVDGGAGAAPVVDIGAYEAQPALDASIAGPYRICQGRDLTLSGFGSSDVPGALTFAWDFDDDGLYDDATGASPLFSTAGYAAPATLPVRLRITDASGSSAEASSTITIVPSVLYVDDSAAGAGTGLGWADAYTDLQTALAQAVAGCEIRVAGGVYKPTTTTDRTISFRLASGTTILGGYAGYGAANPDARDTLVYRTVLSGDIGVVGTSTDNSVHVLVARDLAGTASLDGLIIAAGYAPGSGGSESSEGGGLYLSASQVRVTNSIFVGNYAQSGGAIFAESDSSPVIVNSVFLGNSAYYGGAMGYESFPSPVLANSIFFANTASSAGGAINGYGANIANSIFWSNASPSGSQISGTATITNSDIQGWGIQGWWTGTGNINADPRFVRNPAPGLDGVWGTADDDLGDLRLQAGSPAISAGSNAAVPAGITTDFAGAPRITNGIVDMGVYERDEAPTNLALTGDTLTENQPVDTLVGILGTVDPDINDIHTYSLVSGLGADDNADFMIVGNELRTAEVLDYEAKSSYSIRVRTTDAAGQAIEKVFAVNVTDVDEIAPSVSLVLINDGAAQRSMVKKLEVMFSEQVVLSADALQVKLSTGALPANTTVTVANPMGDQQTYILTFSGTGVIGGSLADGIYDLIVNASGVQDLAGNVMTGNYSQRFHRLFGDSDGNKIVNALDYARLKNSFARSSSDPLFNGAFDYEGNGLINALDLARFRQRYGLSFSY